MISISKKGQSRRPEEAPEASLVDHLERRLALSPPRQKGERTRLRLRIAIAKVLERKGYLSARVSDFSAQAGLAEGSFYVYFRDKTEAALDVLTELVEEFFPLHHDHTDDGNPFAAIRLANRRWFRVCRGNSGLMRCILQLGDEIPDFARLAQRTNQAWYEVVVRSVLRQHPEGAVERNDALLAVYLLGAMMDELTRKLIVYPEPDFLRLLNKLGLDDDGVADAASVVWMRTLYPGQDVDAKLAGAAARLASWR